MQMFHPPTLIAFLFLPFALSACGDTQGQRIATGALGGAAVGQIVADAPVAGAVIGGTVGAVSN